MEMLTIKDWASKAGHPIRYATKLFKRGKIDGAFRHKVGGIFVLTIGMDEEWRPVSGYEGFYEVSDYGRVRRLPKKRVMINRMTMTRYFGVGLNVSGRCKERLVHDLVAQAFIGTKPQGKCVNHKDGDKINNRPFNLEWVTPRENIAHAVRTGLAPDFTGESNPRAKLTRAQVATIRHEHTNYIALARRFGVSPTHICRIRRGERWK